MSDREKGNPSKVQEGRAFEAYNPAPIVAMAAELHKGFNSGPIAQAVQQVAQSSNPTPGTGNTTPQTSPQTGGEKS
jgi:hypothetical protein